MPTDNIKEGITGEGNGKTKKLSSIILTPLYERPHSFYLHKLLVWQHQGKTRLFLNTSSPMSLTRRYQRIYRVGIQGQCCAACQHFRKERWLCYQDSEAGSQLHKQGGCVPVWERHREIGREKNGNLSSKGDDNLLLLMSWGFPLKPLSACSLPRTLSEGLKYYFWWGPHIFPVNLPQASHLQSSNNVHSWLSVQGNRPIKITVLFPQGVSEPKKQPARGFL